jgi:predicted DNA-binding helix-hairpin-helix protein
VYYSAYVPVMKGKNLPAIKRPPLNRENRLYQADWLLRFYKFRAEEILTPEEPDFDEELDPKCNWALRHRELFPVEINRASYEMLLRVPGIGVKSALRIVRLRRYGYLSFDDLHRLGIVMKRACYFITIGGRYYGNVSLDNAHLRNRLISRTAAREVREMSLFDGQT